MELKPCSKCRKRVTDIDIRHGDGVSLKGKFYCRSCAQELNIEIKSDLSSIGSLQGKRTLSDTEFFRRAGKLFDNVDRRKYDKARKTRVRKKEAPPKKYAVPKKETPAKKDKPPEKKPSSRSKQPPAQEKQTRTIHKQTPSRKKSSEDTRLTVMLIGGLVLIIVLIILIAVIVLKSKSHRGDAEGTETGYNYQIKR